MKNPVFILSTGRTGTKYLSQFFSRHAVNVASYHTTRFTRLLNVLGNMYHHKLLSKSMVRIIWVRLKYHEIQSENLRYIECNPYYYNLIDIISSLFPQAKFVFVVRHARSFILSHIKWERERWQSMLANRILPFWQPTSYIDQIRGLRNNYCQRVEFYSKIWTTKNTAILEHINENDKATTVKFEELFHPAQGADGMARLAEWLNITLRGPITRKMITAKVNITKPVERFEWNEHCSRTMNFYCQALLGELGYDEMPKQNSI